MPFSGNANLDVDSLEVVHTVVGINQSAFKALWKVPLLISTLQLNCAQINCTQQQLFLFSSNLSWFLCLWNIFFTTLLIQRIWDWMMKQKTSWREILLWEVEISWIISNFDSFYYITCKVPFYSFVPVKFYLNMKQNFRCIFKNVPSHWQLCLLK